MDFILPPTPISPHSSISARRSTPPTTFDPSLYPPLPDSPQLNTFTNGGDDDLFPSTAHAIERSSNPLLVPLPPSPKIKPALPHRQPKGWVSTLDRRDEEDEQAHDSGQTRTGWPQDRRATTGGTSRRVSARLPSGPDPLRIGGRTISGVMQYAMRPPSPSLPASPSSHRPLHSVSAEPADNAQAPDGIFIHLASPLSPPADIDPGLTTGFSPSFDLPAPDHEENESYSLDEISSSVVGLTDQDNDEVWMAFVRQQLGTLFPDFFLPDESAVLARGVEDDDCGQRGSDSLDGRASDGIGARSDRGTQAGWAMFQDGAHRRPMMPVRQGEYGPVPNVREEIVGLREEIERLRGVVGGLASGLRAAEEPRWGGDVEIGTEGTRGASLTNDAARTHDHSAVVAAAEATPSAPGATHDPTNDDCLAEADFQDGRTSPAAQEIDGSNQEDKDQATVEEMLHTEVAKAGPHAVATGTSQELPAAFVKTAPVSLELLRTLSLGAREARGKLGEWGDDDIFREDNLMELREHLVSLLVGPGAS